MVESLSARVAWGSAAVAEHPAAATAGFSSYLRCLTSPPAAVVLLTNAGELAEGDTFEVLASEILGVLPPSSEGFDARAPSP